MATIGSLPEHVSLQTSDRQQIEAIVASLYEVLREDLVGAYLHGSAVLDGLRPRSDIDVMAVSARRSAPDQKRRLVGRLLEISGRDPAASPPRPVELTIVVLDEIRPWRYPPTMDFQYGEWWRDEFAAGDTEPWPSRTNPDVAPLVKMVLLGGATVFGLPAQDLFKAVPDHDLSAAMTDAVAEVSRDIDGDSRNVVLTLARIWSTVATGTIRSKDGAADWALPRLAPEAQAVLLRARNIYLGTEKERWDDLRPLLRPFVDAVSAEIRAAARGGERPARTGHPQRHH